MPELTRRRVETRNRLIDAAITEFGAHGIDATSVEALCEAAGFTRGAFYSNFTSKDELCLAVIEKHNKEVLEGLDSAFGSIPQGAGLEWALDEGLARYFSVVAPDEAHRRVLGELRQRLIRNPDLAAEAAASDRTTTAGLQRFVDGLAERLGFQLRIDTSVLVATMDAVYLHVLSTEPGAEQSAGELIGQLLSALTIPEARE